MSGDPMSQFSGRKQHAIYGLYLSGEPGTVLYAGSAPLVTTGALREDGKNAGLEKRLMLHRCGCVRTTAKCAARHGIDPLDLHMRVLQYWTSGTEDCPEGALIQELQTHGQCRWNHPYAWTTEDSQRGGRTAMERHPEIHATGARTGAGGRVGGRMKTPAQTAARRAVGLMSMADPKHQAAAARAVNADPKHQVAAARASNIACAVAKAVAILEAKAERGRADWLAPEGMI